MMQGVLIGTLFIIVISLFIQSIAGAGKIIISNPRLGFLNLLGHEGEQLLGEDREVLKTSFTNLEEKDAEPPICHVLFLYCGINQDGVIRGTRSSLRQIIQKSQAPIVVVASPNSAEAYRAAGKKPVSVTQILS